MREQENKMRTDNKKHKILHRTDKNLPIDEKSLELVIHEMFASLDVVCWHVVLSNGLCDVLLLERNNRISKRACGLTMRSGMQQINVSFSMVCSSAVNLLWKWIRVIMYECGRRGRAPVTRNALRQYSVMSEKNRPISVQKDPSVDGSTRRPSWRTGRVPGGTGPDSVSTIISRACGRKSMILSLWPMLAHSSFRKLNPLMKKMGTRGGFLGCSLT